MDPETINTSTKCNEVDELNSSDPITSANSDGNLETKPPLELEQADNKSLEQKNDSSSFSTAFAISFEDNSEKKLGIKDSIRKFAPPKPNTIEKQRQSKADQSQENSLMSIESAPGGLSKHSTPRINSASSRSSSRRSHNSSRHSNISESAAFLIERMLNFKSAEGESNSQSRSSLIDKRQSSPSLQEKSKLSQRKKQTAHSSDDILNNELELCEERSDNGTYIVGTDPESDAARKKIDELFGVVKAAEASVLADSATRNQKISENKSPGAGRQSRVADKKPFNRERQEHINRLARKNSSRSSSSSRLDNSQNSTCNDKNRKQSRASSNHSRNSSCDKTQKPDHNAKPRRAASQSSRQSSNKELSDCDTRSSRSSLHNEALDAVNLEDHSQANYPSMKFNRAFALRRARLGLGEPTRAPQNPIHIQDSESMSKINSSQRRHQINTNTYRASQNQSSGSASFCRDDGGRFSLRMKQQSNPLSNRLNSAHHTSTNRSPQHSAALESYMSRVSESKIHNSATNSGLSSELSLNRNQSQRHSVAQPAYTISRSLCQSGDEQEATSNSARYKSSQNAGRSNNKGGLVEMDAEFDSYNNRFIYSPSQDQNFNIPNENRASTSTGKRENVLPLGALDSLLISATSSLSKKICQSVCEVLVEHAKKLPVENDTRLIVEEILPQLTANSSTPKSPTSIEEINQSLSVDLTKTLKNLKKIEQMVEVIALISNQIPLSSSSSNAQNINSHECNKSDLS